MWEIASKFEKGKKGMTKAAIMQNSDGKREVMFRDVSGLANRGDRYAPSSERLDKVESNKS